MYKYEDITIEVTRKCNKSCGFCMRGEPQNVTVSEEFIDKFFDDIQDVKNILLTGGEPFLELSKIEYIVNSIIEHKFNLLNLQIVTNGTILDESILETLEKLYALSKTEVFIGISNNPEFYDTEQSKSALQFYEEIIKAKRLHIHVGLKEDDRFAYAGKGKQYVDIHRKMFYPYGNIRISRNENELGHRIKVLNNTIHCDIGLSANGLVGMFGDRSYNEQEKIAFGNIMNTTLTKLIDKYNDSCIKLCNESFMFAEVYDNLDFLPPAMQDYRVIFYEFQRLHTIEVWHKRELVKNRLPLLPAQAIIDALPLVDLAIVEYKHFNSYSEDDYKKTVKSHIWERYLEEKELNPEMSIYFQMVFNALVDLNNKERKSKPNQNDVFLNDAEFIKSDTYKRLEMKHKKYKFGLLKRDNGKVYECDRLKKNN